MIYAILRRHGEIRDYVPPISLVLGSEPKTYIDSLGAYSQGDVSVWCERLADATTLSARAAEQFAIEIADHQATWLVELSQPRKDAAIRQVIEALPEHPIIDVAAAQKLTAKSHVAVGAALKRLEEAGILKKLNERKWGRVWECDQILSLVDNFEKSVATP